MTWQIRQVQGVAEHRHGKPTKAIIGLSGSVVHRGLTMKQADRIKAQLNEQEPDAIYSIEADGTR